MNCSRWGRASLCHGRLDIDDQVVRLVRKDRVPGSQIASMTLIELMQDLSMSKLQVRLGELVRLEP